MKHRTSVVAGVAVGLAVAGVAAAGVGRHVNPFIGAADNGHTFPGATVPFGLVQPGPETGNKTWAYCSGYHYEDPKIHGFAQTHLNGTGCPDLGDVLLQPFTGAAERTDFASAFAKSTESASPGYYAVTLADFGVKAEVTATARTALHRWTFASGPARVLVDLQYGIVSSEKSFRNHVLACEASFEDDRTLSGHTQASAWVKRHYYYVVRFDRPIRSKTVLPSVEGERGVRHVLEFDVPPGGVLQAKVALSTVGIDGARANLEAEAAGWEFDAVRAKAAAAWDELLSRVEVDGTDAQKESFYTSLYHLFIQPNNIADVDGRYRGADDRVASSPSKAYYSTFSLWDTYRAAHPLYTILSPERVDGFVDSMLRHFDAQGYLPIWTLWGRENHCMIGNHSIPVIVDAYLKGFRGFDGQRAMEAILSSSTRNHPKSDWDAYVKHGYLPFDVVKEESVSRTLEFAFDDHAAARLARALGREADATAFEKRAGCFRNLFDAETGFMRGRDAAGRWRTPFDLFELSHAGTGGGDYTEGNAWQYTWSVQHDVPALIALLGGPDAFANKLEQLFKLSSTTKGKGWTGDVTGLIGQYAHGNEPSHHVAYLFALAGRAWRTQELLREIVDRFYLNKPDGLCGNDDCGQMSAWYVFTAMGFYPVNPVGGEYVLGAPQVPRVSVALPGGRRFTVEARNLSAANKYVRSIELNGKPCDRPFITHREIMDGGRLVFTLGPEPVR